MDISGIFRFIFMACIVIFHIRGFYTNEVIESLYQIPFLGQILFNGPYVNQFFFTLSGYYIAKKYGGFEKGQNDFLLKHYIKFMGLSLLTLPIGILFHYLYYLEKVNLLNCILDIMLIRTGYGIGIGNPYNQPLWFLDVLFIIYIVYYFIIYIFKSHSKWAALIITLFSAASIHGGIWIPLPDTRVLYALFAFFMGNSLYNLYFIVNRNARKVNFVIIVTSIAFIILFVIENVFSGNIYEIYSGGDVWIVLQIFLWCPFVCICTSIYSSKVVIQKISKTLGRISASVFIWHYPIIYFSIVLFRIIGLNPEKFLYTVGQLVIIIFISSISSYIFEPRINKCVRNLAEKYL